MKIKGIIFDMDGVITQTATLHFKAWKITIENFFTQIFDEKKLFTENDYFHYLDGMTRKEGVANYFLNIGLSEDMLKGIYKNLEECIEDLCKKKNTLLLQILSEETVECFPDSLKFIEFLLLQDYKIGLISSSKNCLPILKKTQIDNIFSVYVDGLFCEQMNLPGKPHPAIFLEAAKRLDLLPEECLIVEDAIAGVCAAKKGGFGVVALDRKNKLYKDFLKFQPDFVLNDLSSNQTFLYHQLRKHATLQPGFKSLSCIMDLIENENQLAIFLDYDGTLTPIVETPDKAVLSQRMFHCLTQLSQNYLTVIMSGRELKNLKKLINVPTIFYSGNHGLEFIAPNDEIVSYQVGEEFKEELSFVYLHLVSLLRTIEGCIVENKKYSLSIHYRLVSESKHLYISQVIDEVLSDCPNLIRHSGKKVFEIRPNIIWNKGVASAFILNNLKLKNPNIIPLYIGDDLSDEDAFETFDKGGITIKVMDQPETTKAHYFLNSPSEVENFLCWLNILKEI